MTSGVAEHITNNIKILTDYKEEKTSLKFANGTICEFIGHGNCCLNINGHHIKLENVLYSPMITMNIISSIKLIKTGIKAVPETKNNKVTLKLINNSKIITKIISNNLNQFIIKSNLCRHEEIQVLNTMIKIDEKSKLIWHRRLGHFYFDNIEKYLKLQHHRTFMYRLQNIKNEKKST